MADRSSTPDPVEAPDRYPGTPRWVKVVGIIAVLVLVLVAFILITGLGGPHGPQRHGASLDRSVGFSFAEAAE